MSGGGHPLFVCAGSPRIQHVAGPLQLSFPGELRRGRAPRSSGLPAILAGPSWGSRHGHAPAAGPWRIGFPGWKSCCLDVGLLLSLYTGYRIASVSIRRASQALKMLRALGSALIVLLFAAGVWIVLQPMQMRGTLQPVG